MIFSVEKEAVVANGVVVAYHEVNQAHISPDGEAIAMVFESWPNKESRIAGHPPVGTAHFRVPIADLVDSNQLIGELSSLAVGTGWLSGGVVTTEDDVTPEMQKKRQWASVKAARDRMEHGGFTWGESVFDSDPLSQSRIQGAVILAMQSISTNTPFSVDWTLKDNTVRTLSATDLIQVGAALAQHVQTAHVWARARREEIYGT